MRRFELHRDRDATGISGTGIVAQGAQFDDGTCVLRWLSEHRSTAVYASADDVELIHGHGGQTRLVWLDPPPARGGWTADRLQVLRQVARRQDIMRRLGTIP
jgi:hypothetical protein